LLASGWLSGLTAFIDPHLEQVIGPDLSSIVMNITFPFYNSPLRIKRGAVRRCCHP
jgi:hypothetical protein